MASHRELDGNEPSPRLAAVELLNIIRPAVAVCWFVAHAGHALHRWPQHRQRLSSGATGFAEAFAHELRRFYPFAPFLGGRAVVAMLRTLAVRLARLDYQVPEQDLTISLHRVPARPASGIILVP